MALVGLGACGGGGGAAGPIALRPTLHPELTRVEYGRLVDVYGLEAHGAGKVMTLYRRDIVIGADIQDERDTRSPKTDDEVLYDFVGADPDTLQPRLFIPRLLGSDAFLAAFEALDDHLREIAPMMVGEQGLGGTYGVVPRNAGIRLTFSADLGLGDDFFVERNGQGQVVGLRNTEAVQLLQIAGDPNGPNASAAFRPVPMRIVVDGRYLTLDPVLMGSEGLQYQTRNNAAGLPAAPDQQGANLRIALALEGPLALPGLRPREGQELLGWNNSGRPAVVRDMRSGHPADNSSDLARGFVRDPIPPRLVGEIVMYLEQVDPVNAQVDEITIWKNGVRHEIDRGDGFRFVTDNSGVAMGVTSVVEDPADDQGQPDVQRVRVRVRATPGLRDIDPRRLPGYPTDPAARGPWLVLNAPKAILSAEFSAGGALHPQTGLPVGDDPRYFLTFSPVPLPLASGQPSPPDQNVSPFAGAVVRFTKPVDLGTVRPADTFFFGTRNLLDQAAIDDFVQNRPNSTATPGMDPAAFDPAKYRTPHLIGGRLFDEDGSQTALRLQPTMGFHLDDRMRNPQPADDFRYWLHLLSGANGIRDLSGNPVDLQADTVARAGHLAIPFSVDTRSITGRPIYENNLVVYVVRRMASDDEDPQPSYHLPGEVSPPRNVLPGPRAEAQPLADVFGAFVYVDGWLQARPTTRMRRIADNLNQAPVAAQTSPLRWCPETINGQPQVATNTATTPFGQGIQNPLNPYGARLQTVWREVDLSLSRTDPFDFNLDVEQMYWAPFTGSSIRFDEFDRVTLLLGHSERRPEPCTVGGFPTMPNSGLNTEFDANYLRNLRAQGTAVDTQPLPFPAYVDAPLTIESGRAVPEPNGVNRFLPLPAFQKPYFVWRDETVIEQGCTSGISSDTSTGQTYTPYILSPWLSGQGRRFVSANNTVITRSGAWNNANNRMLVNRSATDAFTDGLVGSVAAPLLGDFWTYCDQASLPAGSGYIAQGSNGWQISITVQVNPNPSFRAYTAGRPPLASGAPSVCRGPGTSQWLNASGGFTPGGAVTQPRDNSLYWIMIDFLKRATVVTNGFLDLNNPHRVPEGFADSRLGPFYLNLGNNTRPADIIPVFVHDVDPPASLQPGGTSVVVQFRAAGPVDPDPWYWREWYAGATAGTPPVSVGALLQPNATNFPLDPYKAGDAHIRKFDDRAGSSGTRNWWTGFYNRNVTGYVEDANTLMNQAYLDRYRAPGDVFTRRDVRYVNWRFLMTNNTDAVPPVSPAIDTFILGWRFERR